MEFAHFSHVWTKAGMTPEQRYAQLWREIELCDTLGYDYAFCVEHHFSPEESWMSSPTLFTVGAGARTKNIRLGGMGSVVPLHNPVRLLEELAIIDQMIGGRLEIGLVPGAQQSSFNHFGADFKARRDITLEFAKFAKTAYAGGAPITYDSPTIACKEMTISVQPIQKPYPPMWMETRDPATIAFCAEEGLNTGYFLMFPRKIAKARYAPYLEGWKRHGWTKTPRIAYSTVVYVDETDDKAMEVALADAATAYKGFFTASDDPAVIKEKQAAVAQYFVSRGELESAEILMNILDPDYLLANDLILIGSPKTVTEKLRAWAEEGTFNTFFGEFNFGNMKEDDLMRSLRLFGTEVAPKLRDYEPFSVA